MGLLFGLLGAVFAVVIFETITSRRNKNWDRVVEECEERRRADKEYKRKWGWYDQMLEKQKDEYEEKQIQEYKKKWGAD